MGDAQQHIAAIRAALKMGPTPGPWRATLGSDQMADPGTTVYHRGHWGVYTDAEGHGNATADAAHIAACNPEAMRAILAHIEALEADAERLNWMIFHSAVCLHSRDGEWCRVKWVEDNEEFVTKPFADPRDAIDAARKEADRG